ncbi:methanol dehydrogenase [Desulfoluna limicola]|uniref:Methanol dehydrogenase n=1 Tax=Desulfoluna limicola TaxID=2810562 RepID=A0ABM7PJF5_9BACT|nr:TPM domain-containing protein [Desulfoluna limicola]BCS97206.1 methanol dehydrogenase [Desulfoluna limicola]
MNKRRIITWGAILAVLLPIWAFAAIFPDKPPSEHYYVDEAGLIDVKTGGRIDGVASALLAEENIPIYVVTIPSLAAYDAATLSIEQYAAELFDHWGIGWQDHNYGMLLLVSKDDKKARIELGADWGKQNDYLAQQVMGGLIVPAFKRGDFATGIADGVRGMDAMARGQAFPKPKAPWWMLPALIGGLGALVLLIINLFRSGRKGWAWALIAVLGSILFFILQIVGSGSDSGEGSSGGGFGGGSSGGGGATGSW